MTERRERGWLPEGRSNPPKRGVLEDTLFRRLEEMRKKPPGELFELLERTLEVLRATKEALLEQRREIRSLATAVDTLRSRVDQLVQNRPPVQQYGEPQPYGETEPYEEPEPSLEVEAEPEPEPAPGVELEPEPEPDLLPAAEHTPDRPLEETGSAERALENAAFEDTAPDDSAPYEAASEDTAFEDTDFEDTVFEDTVFRDTVFEETTLEPDLGHDEPVVERETEHVLMLSTAAGYRIVIGDGAEPSTTIEVDGIVFAVTGRMGSPFPGDTRTAWFATRTDSSLV
jgi:hypothetical protein